MLSSTFTLTSHGSSHSVSRRRTHINIVSCVPTHTQTHTAFLSLFLTHMHRESGQRYMPSRSHLTSEGQQVSTIPVRCGQCNYPSATALTIIRHGKIALSITKQASVAHIAGLSLIDLFLYLAGPQIRSLSFFLSLWASYTHTHTQPLRLSLTRAYTRCLSFTRAYTHCFSLQRDFNPDKGLQPSHHIELFNTHPILGHR